MKKILLIIALISFISVSKLFSQDLIYTIIGKIDNQITSIDSIAVENITNGTAIGFGRLPVRDDYRINLTQKTFWGSTSIPLIDQQENFFIQKNSPGYLEIVKNRNSNSDIKVTVFNINGQKVGDNSKLYQGSGNTIQVRIGMPGIYIVSVVSGSTIQKFKTIGARSYNSNNSVSVSIDQSGLSLKSESLVFGDFYFHIGDSLRISAFKNDYFAQSQTLKISTGTSLTFQFEQLSLPLVRTLFSEEISGTSEKIYGQIVSDGKSEIVEKGFYWSQENPTPDENDRTIIVNDTATIFSAIITGLGYNKIYSCRAFAQNKKGKTLGDAVSFRSGMEIITDSLVDARDGKAYKTVKIGDQWWMSENLAYLPNVTKGSYTSNGLLCYVYGYSGSSVAEAKSTENYKKYGVLYNWEHSMIGGYSDGSQTTPSDLESVCPANWHLPSDGEWMELEKYFGMDGKEIDLTGFRGSNQGGMLKSSNGWAYNGNNASGFSGLPGGLRDGEPSDWFSSINETGYWWSATTYNNDLAWSRSISNNKNGIRREVIDLTEGLSIRCVKNDSKPIVNTTTVTNITPNSAVLSGIIKTDKGLAITERGFYWSKTNHNPDDSDSKIIDTGTGDSLRVALSNLDPTTTYYYRAFAKNENGIGYGSTELFHTYLTDSIVDNRDNRSYKTVKIGSQWWMAENLAYLPSVRKVSDYSYDYGRYYVYGYDGSSISDAKKNKYYIKYGALYNWPAAKEACPAGWYLPSDRDWKALEMAIGIDNSQVDSTGNRGSMQGKQLKLGINWENGDYGKPDLGTNSNGFNALPGGNTFVWTYSNMDKVGEWWSGSAISNNAWMRTLRATYYDISRNTESKMEGLSVRCIKSGNPVVTTLNASSIGDTYVTISGLIESDGGAPITEMGFYWSETNPNPSISDNHIIVKGTDAQFITTINGLTLNSTYYYVAYSVSSEGFALGEVKAFKTKAPVINEGTGMFTDSRDGKTYRTVKIGNQWWMSQNLAFLPEVNPTTDISYNKAYYYVANYSGYDVETAKNTLNYSRFGVLYNFTSATQVCPSGWHLPGNNEWTILEDYIKTNRLNYVNPDESYDAQEFSVQFGGFLNSLGKFYSQDDTGYWWSKDINTMFNEVYVRYVYKSNGKIEQNQFEKVRGLSVRCVKD